MAGGYSADPPYNKCMVRLAHISDMHLTTKKLGWTWRDWFSKRFVSWTNLRLRRGRRFIRAEYILGRLAQDFAERRIDHVVFSGDATALGFESEMQGVADILGVKHRPGLAVPGNHDYATPWAVASGAFERCFANWLHGERIGDETYPFAQRVGHVWLIGVNSAKPNFWFWDASGRVGVQQLDRLRELLNRLTPGPRILVTHYPVCLEDEKPEKHAHKLHDLDATLTVARAGGICLWLHGHRHGFYHVPNLPHAPFPIICAGSTTQTGLWSYGEYKIDDHDLHVTRRVFDPAADSFVNDKVFTLDLRTTTDVRTPVIPTTVRPTSSNPSII